ncbi:hypothetical protein CCO02nite_27410 [Cellulomonas composti]|uniref:Uncharacterized protein n=1 Tax=Cellulomonas composti TaxID=266130 RepID=A0A511JEA7_9CELL|nr:hypothetical protein CCO02nite_27410 [Cellulomonas composti]
MHAEVLDGFHAAEAPALQRAIVGALGLSATHLDRVHDEVELVRGKNGRVALVWHEAFVGFAPHDREAALTALLDAHPDAVVQVPGTLFRVGMLWRVWIGVVPLELPPVPDRLDELPVQEPSIFGMPINRLRH